ncbi:hypothetical protein D3C71_1744590 [compost metagenome]
MGQIDEDRVVVEEVGVVRQALRQIGGHHLDVGVLESDSHDMQLGALEVKTGAGNARRISGHGRECERKVEDASRKMTKCTPPP